MVDAVTTASPVRGAEREAGDDPSLHGANDRCARRARPSSTDALQADQITPEACHEGIEAIMIKGSTPAELAELNL
jgi:hypothetical protein